MNKKEYKKPSFKVFEIESIQLLAGSGPGDGQGGLGGGPNDNPDL